MKKSEKRYYKNGFRKWSSFSMISRLAFIVSLLSLITAFLKPILVNN